MKTKAVLISFRDFLKLTAINNKHFVLSRALDLEFLTFKKRAATVRHEIANREIFF